MATQVAPQCSHESVNELLALVRGEVEAARAAESARRELALTNSALRRSLHATIHAAHRAAALDGAATNGATGGEAESTPRAQELLMLRTTSFFASSSAILRQRLEQATNEHALARVATTEMEQERHTQPLTREQQAEMAWVLHSLPQPSVAGAATPALPSIPPSPSPLPLASHQSPYCSLEYPLARVSNDWRSYFPSEMLASGLAAGGMGSGNFGPGEASATDLQQWLKLVEDIWDSLQNNRALFDEFIAGVKGGASAATAAVSTAATPASANPSSRADNGDSVMSHAMENYGFLTDTRLQASMVGLGTEAPPPGGVGSGHHTYEFDEADGPSNIVMESEPDGTTTGTATGTASGATGTASSTSTTSTASGLASATAPRSIKCATLSKLIERVTHEQYVDLNTRYVFLLTYHSFTTPRELLALLARRFHVPLPPHLTPRELGVFKATKLDRIQIRVCSVLKNWIDEHWADFEEDSELKRALQVLVATMLENSGSPLTTQLAKALAALVGKKEKLQSSVPPSPLRSVSSKEFVEGFDLMACDELEMARQLTLLDFAKFRSIQPRECLNQNWSKPPAIKAALAPNILGMIHQFNRVSLWLQLTILHEKDLKTRAKLVDKFIRIGYRCRSVNNFNSCFAIYCGLTSNPIHRLKRTFALVPAKSLARFGEMQELFRGDKNSRNFRRVLQQALTPCIPHLGIFLSDLTFIEDGNPDRLVGGLMINFQKRCKLAERIRWVKQYQQEAFTFVPVPNIQAYLEHVWMQEADADTLWKMSKEVEAREA